MKYFRNTDVAKKFNISQKTVGNWVEAARLKKLNLQLTKVEDKYHIINNSHNLNLLDNLAQKGKKYKNKKFVQTIEPKPEFYNIFTENEILDIIFNLEVYKELPFEYSYFGEGAEYWDKYVNKRYTQPGYNNLKDTMELLGVNTTYISNITKDSSAINIIDLGPGNGQPGSKLIQHFYQNKTLNKYIGADLSPNMLKILEKNLKSIFNNDIHIEKYIKNLHKDTLIDLTYFIPVKEGLDNLTNLLLFLGGTVKNFRNINKAFALIHESMNKNDILVCDGKLDSINSRNHFDFGVNDNNPSLDEQDQYLLQLLNLADDFYETKFFYDEKYNSRYIKIKFTVDIDINFKIKDIERIVSFDVNDELIVWRAIHQTYDDIINTFKRNHFDILQTTKSLSGEQLMVIAKIKQD